MIERRRHRRILTLKNFGWFAGALALLFVILSFDVFTRGGAAGDYGRLMNRRLPAGDDLHPRAQQVVTEAPPVPDQTAADPLLLAPAAREQEFLSAQTPAPVTAQVAAPIIETRGSGNGVSIVGEGESVTIVRGGDAKRPLLAGGIFKQH